MTDTEKIELLRAALARIQAQRLDAISRLDAALARFATSQEQEQAAQASQRVTAEEITALRQELATLATTEGQYARELTDLQRIIGVVQTLTEQQTAADPATTEPAPGA